MSKIYLVGSLRNERIPIIANALRDDGHEVFDDWHGAGETADDSWRSYEQARGRKYHEAIKGKAASNICEFDRSNILASDIVILILPAGRSGHMEIGFAAGAGKRTHILLDADYDRWDVMYRLADHVWSDINPMRSQLFLEDTTCSSGISQRHTANSLEELMKPSYLRASNLQFL